MIKLLALGVYSEGKWKGMMANVESCILQLSLSTVTDGNVLPNLLIQTRRSIREVFDDDCIPLIGKESSPLGAPVSRTEFIPYKP